MATEIERKFLVIGTAWRDPAAGTVIRQGYLSTVKERSVRVRVVGEKGFLTVKGLSVGAARAEFEYEIPAAEAGEMLDGLCERPLIEKTRYVVPFAGHSWEIDEFAGVNAGLVVAEIELADEDEAFKRPPWLGDEVTEDARYFNVNLIAHPYETWK